MGQALTMQTFSLYSHLGKQHVRLCWSNLVFVLHTVQANRTDYAMLALRDTPIGQLLRTVGFKRFFLFPEEVEEFRSKILEDLENKRNVVTQPSSSGNTLPQPTEKTQETSIDKSPESNMNQNAGATPDNDDVLPVGWYGPDDPGNPRNWSTCKKAWVTVVIWYVYPAATIDHHYSQPISVYTFVVYGASSIVVPATG